MVIVGGEADYNCCTALIALCQLFITKQASDGIDRVFDNKAVDLVDLIGCDLTVGGRDKDIFILRDRS